MSLQSNITQASGNLLMMSESDFPFTYVNADATALSPDLALSLTGKPAGTPVEQTDIDHLLRNMTDPSRGSVSPAMAQRFQHLATTLKQELKDLTVYRVGEVQVEVLILGLTPDGKVAGLRTQLVET